MEEQLRVIYTVANVRNSWFRLPSFSKGRTLDSPSVFCVVVAQLQPTITSNFSPPSLPLLTLLLHQKVHGRLAELASKDGGGGGGSGSGGGGGAAASTVGGGGVSAGSTRLQMLESKLQWYQAELDTVM